MDESCLPVLTVTVIAPDLRASNLHSFHRLSPFLSLSFPSVSVSILCLTLALALFLSPSHTHIGRKTLGVGSSCHLSAVPNTHAPYVVDQSCLRTWHIHGNAIYSLYTLYFSLQGARLCCYLKTKGVISSSSPGIFPTHFHSLYPIFKWFFFFR